MKILIVGSVGFIGANALRYFSSRGHNVTGCDIVESPTFLIGQYITIDAVSPNFAALFVSSNYDVCINASGSAHVGFSFEDPAKDFELNVLNVNRLLVAIRKYNPACRFINFSSAAVYGNPVRLPITEDIPTKPLSPYGFHKLQSEYLLTEYHKFFGLHTCSLRVFSAYGPGLRKQLFWDMYQKTRQPEHIQLFGTGSESRDFIYIEDLLRVVELIIESDIFEGNVINVASGKETTIREAAGIFYEILDPKLTFSFSGKVKAGDPNNWRADIQTTKLLKFQPHWNLTEGLIQYIQWLKENV